MPQGLPRVSDLKVSNPVPRRLASAALFPRSRRIPSRLQSHRRQASVSHTLLTVRQLKRDAQHSETYVTQLFESYKEHKHSQDELSRFREIRQQLKADNLLGHLSNTHGLVRDNYSQFRAKDGSTRIKTGSRAYNVSDFCTQHMGMSWDETKVILKQVYGQQRQLQRHQQRTYQEQHAINSIVFVSNQVTQGWGTHHRSLDASIRLLKYLQRKEQYGGLPMLSALERYRTPETKENAIHSAKEDFSLTETAKRIMQARETAAQITLTMNDVVASKNEKKQHVDFLDKNSGDKLFRDTGDRLVMLSRQPELNHTAVALTLAAEKFGVVKITGTKEFKQQVIDVAVSKDLNIVFADKSMEAEFVRRKEELKQASSAESAKVQENAKAASEQDESNAMIKSTVDKASSSDNPGQNAKQEPVKEEPVTLVAHGQAPYQHKEDNSQSYFVELSNGETKWGVKLKDAIEESGAQIGDEISVSRVGAKDVEVEVQPLDENGNKLPSETISTQRNEWVVDVHQATASPLQSEPMSDEIKALRSHNHWSQKELADLVGVSSSTVSKWERGKSEPTAEHVEKLDQLKNHHSQNATSKATDELKPSTYSVDYAWDKLTGKTSVTINGENPGKFNKATVEKIAQNDPFLKHFSADDIRYGLLDRSKAKTDQPIPRVYDAQAHIVDDVAKQNHTAKLK